MRGILAEIAQHYHFQKATKRKKIDTRLRLTFMKASWPMFVSIPEHELGVTARGQ